MVVRVEDVRDFIRGVDERVDVFGDVLGRLTHELDGLTRKVAELEKKVDGLVPMVIDTGEVSFETDVGQYEGEGEPVPIREVVRTLVPVEDTEGGVGDSLPSRFTRSLRRLDELVEDLVDRSQARDLSDYGTAPLAELGDLGELFQL